MNVFEARKASFGVQDRPKSFEDEIKLHRRTQEPKKWPRERQEASRKHPNRDPFALATDSESKQVLS